MRLRLHQKNALESSKERYIEGIYRQVVSLPGGLGKTVVFANLRGHHGFTKRVLILVHTDELAIQALAKVRTWNPGVRVGLEMGDSYCQANDIYVVASVQTLGRAGSARINRFKPSDFDAVICDECHHSTTDSYQRIFKHFGFTDGTNEGRLLFGVTATTKRGDGQGLDSTYDEIVYHYSLLQAISDGWLVNLRGFRVRTGTSLDEVHSANGELNQGELSLAVNTPDRNKAVVEAWLKDGEDRQTLAFTVDIQHAKDLAQAFRDAGVAAEAVWGIDPERKRKLADHRACKMRVICNAAMLVEGYDDWQIGCVINAKPTKSETAYQQMVLRGTRLPEGISNLLEAIAAGMTILKSDCIIMDVADNTRRHSLASIGTLVGLPPKLDLKGGLITLALDEIEEAVKLSPETDFDTLENLEDIQSYIERVDLFASKYSPEVLAHSELQWHRTPRGNYLLSLPNNESIVIGKDFIGKWNIEGVVRGSHFMDRANDIAEAFDSADKMLRFFGKQLLPYVRRDNPIEYGKAMATNNQVKAINSKLARMHRPQQNIAAMTSVAAAQLLRSLYARTG